MGIFDWLGPLNAGGRSRGWGDLPTPASPFPETRALDLSHPRPLFVEGLGPSFWTPATTTIGPADARSNSAVEACLGVLAQAVVEPDLAVYRAGSSDGSARTPGALPALAELLAKPNPYLSISTLLAQTTVSLHTDGNGYWRKVRSGDPIRGNVVQLWPVAPGRMTPYTRPGSDDFVTSYTYTDEHGRESTVDPANVVHFRYGLDPDDHRLGYAPLRKLLAEVSADQQATRYAARLLANLAINGLTLSFDKEAPPIDQATADELKLRIMAAYGGDNVGSVAVIAPGGTLTALGFSPEQMDMKTLHRVPEERISAVLGVPAIVAGLGAGLDRSTYANARESREMFTETKLMPFWAALAETITMSLVPDFTSDRRVFVAFDTSTVRALSEDQDALATRLQTLVAAGIVTVDEARAQLGLGAAPGQPAPVGTRSRGTHQDRFERSSDLDGSPRPTVVRLPRRKAIEDLLGDFDDLERSSLPDWEREIRAFLKAQLGRVSTRLGSGVSTAFGLVPEGEAILLGEALAPLQLALLDDVVPLVVAELGIAFGLDDPATREYLRAAGANIGGITDTTRRAVQDALLEGQAAGEGIPDLARRLRDLPAFGPARATLIARTELATSQNQAALSSYRASGVVVGVRVHDGDYDEACAAMDGRTFPLGQEPAMLHHPQCVRAFSPVLDADELTRSA